MNGEDYIHRMNCEFAGYADQILQQKGVTCKPVYWSERDDWTLAMVAAGLGFAFMPANAVKHPGVIGLPVVEPEFWREVKPGERERASLFAGGRLAGARGDAEDMVRQRAEASDGFRGRACAGGRRQGAAAGSTDIRGGRLRDPSAERTPSQAVKRQSRSIAPARRSAL